MRLERRRAIGIFREIGAIGEAFLEEDVHHAAGKRAVRPRPRHEVNVRNLGGRRAVGIDNDEGRAALLARAGDPAHQVDLRRDRIAAPHHDEIGTRQFARIDPALHPDAGAPAGIGQRVAVCRVLAGVAHDVAQPLDAIALHQAHCAGIEERPDALGAVTLRRAQEALRHEVERVVPGQGREGGAPLALGADPPQRRGEPLGMVLALGIAGDLGADDSGGIRVIRRAADAAYGSGVEPLHRERADARAIVRADRGNDVARHGSII